VVFSVRTILPVLRFGIGIHNTNYHLKTLTAPKLHSHVSTDLVSDMILATKGHSSTLSRQESWYWGETANQNASRTAILVAGTCTRSRAPTPVVIFWNLQLPRTNTTLLNSENSRMEPVPGIEQAVRGTPQFCSQQPFAGIEGGVQCHVRH